MLKHFFAFLRLQFVRTYIYLNQSINLNLIIIIRVNRSEREKKMKVEKKQIIENKVALSLREKSTKKILFRLVNTKRAKSKAFSIYEAAKLSTTIDKAFNNQYRKVDIDYDTTSNNRFKKCNLLIDDNLFLDPKKKSLYLDLLNSNKEFIKNNKVSSEIIESQKYFENLVNNLK